MIMGDKTGLRPVEETDLELLARWRNDPQIRRMFFTPLLFSLASQRQWYKELVGSSTRMQFMAIRLSDGKTIGTVGFDNIDYRNQNAEMGSLIVDPEERRLHYGIDFAKTLIRYGFHELNLHRIYGRVFAFNNPTITAAEKVGFQVEGIARRAAFAAGEFHDVVLVAILRDEWQG